MIVDDDLRNILVRIEHNMQSLQAARTDAAEFELMLAHRDFRRGLDDGSFEGPAVVMLEKVVRDNMSDTALAVTCLTFVASCYCSVVRPDSADVLVAECLQASLEADLEDPLWVVNLGYLADLDEQLGNIARSEATWDRLSEVVDRDDYEDYVLRVADPSLVNDLASRNLAADDELRAAVRACDGSDPGAEERLLAMLAEPARYYGHLVALGWYRIGLLRWLAERWADSHDALEHGMTYVNEASPEGRLLAGDIARRFARYYHETRDGDPAIARQWFHRSISYYFSVMLASGDPLIRPAYSERDDWADDLILLACDLDEGPMLFTVVSLLQAHGLLEVVRDRAAATRPDPRGVPTDVRDLFRRTWTTELPVAAEFLADLPDGCAAIHCTLVREFGELHVLTQLLGPGQRVTTRMSRIDDRRLSRIIPVTLASLTAMRHADWHELTECLLVDAVLEDRLEVDRLLLAPSPPLANIPFGLLPTNGGLLGERYELTTVPQLTLWPALPPVVPSLDHVAVVALDAHDHSTHGVEAIETELDTLAGLGATIHRIESTADMGRLPSSLDALIFGLHGTASDDRNVWHMPDGERFDAHGLASMSLPPLVIAGVCYSGSLQGSPSPFSFVPAALVGGASAIVMTLYNGSARSISSALDSLYRSLGEGVPVSRALYDAQSHRTALSVAERFPLVALAR